MFTSTKTGIMPQKSRFTVVGKPAAAVITSSSGLRARSRDYAGGERGKRDEIGGRTGIHRHGIARADLGGEFVLESSLNGPVVTKIAKPELTSDFHVARIEDPARHRTALFPGVNVDAAQRRNIPDERHYVASNIVGVAGLVIGFQVDVLVGGAAEPLYSYMRA